VPPPATKSSSPIRSTGKSPGKSTAGSGSGVPGSNPNSSRRPEGLQNIGFVSSLLESAPTAAQAAVNRATGKEDPKLREKKLWWRYVKLTPDGAVRFYFVPLTEHLLHYEVTSDPKKSKADLSVDRRLNSEQAFAKISAAPSSTVLVRPTAEHLRDISKATVDLETRAVTKAFLDGRYVVDRENTLLIPYCFPYKYHTDCMLTQAHCDFRRQSPSGLLQRRH